MVTGDACSDVRSAKADDADYVRTAFDHCLGRYYDGDHINHANRIIESWSRDGRDTRGLLSVRQKTFVLMVGSRRCGVLNLAIKKQGTCKISPLIVFAEDGRPCPAGSGAALLAVAEREALRTGAHQLYCTVAEKNTDAMDFFRRNGFVASGQAQDQYRRGSTEMVLRRVLRRPSEEPIISVGDQVTDDEWPAVRRFLMEHQNPRVPDSGEDWLDALRAGGYVCRASDRTGRLLAVAVASPKKGGAVKVMPVAAIDQDGFRALVVDLPSLLEKRGHKAFLHLNPDPSQVLSLQAARWELEALLPEAYCVSETAQQWGHSLVLDGEATVRNLRIRREYFELIRSGRKTLEIRVGYDNIKRITPGTDIRLMCDEESLLCRVRDVRRHDSFEKLLADEDIERALPGMAPDEALTRLRRIYPRTKEDLGVYVLELEPRATTG
ncbi:MAG TPA: ASCH domain-containing protein [Pseudonocardiaceae bacterium]